MNNPKRDEFLSRYKAETDANIADIIKRQELANEMLSEPLSEEGEIEVQSRLDNLGTYIGEDIVI